MAGFRMRISMANCIYVTMLCAMVVLAGGYIYHAYSLTAAIVTKASIVVPKDMNTPAVPSNLRSKAAIEVSETAVPTIETAHVSHFCVNMTTMSKVGIGSSILKIHEDWAPLGFSRFSELLEDHYFDGAKFFRVLKVYGN
jgi:hypothetical protein